MMGRLEVYQQGVGRSRKGHSPRQHTLSLQTPALCRNAGHLKVHLSLMKLLAIIPLSPKVRGKRLLSE